MSDNLNQIKEEISGLVKCDVIKEQVLHSVRAAVKDVAEGRITWQSNLLLGPARRVKWINVKTELLQNKAP